jgi:1-acyl-sn-glycerol-3-phosphate acyltransferase
MIPIERENLKSAIATINNAGELVIREKKTMCIAAEGTRRRSNSIGPDHLLPLKKGPLHMAKACNVDIVPACIIGANRLFAPGQMLPRPGTMTLSLSNIVGTLVVRYLEKIPKEVVETSSLEELQKIVEKKLKEGLEPIPDQVIYSTDKRPMGYFIFLLCFLYAFWSFILRFIM